MNKVDYQRLGKKNQNTWRLMLQQNNEKLESTCLRELRPVVHDDRISIWCTDFDDTTTTATTITTTTAAAAATTVTATTTATTTTARTSNIHQCSARCRGKKKQTNKTTFILNF